MFELEVNTNLMVEDDLNEAIQVPVDAATRLMADGIILEPINDEE